MIGHRSDAMARQYAGSIREETAARMMPELSPLCGARNVGQGLSSPLSAVTPKIITGRVPGRRAPQKTAPRSGFLEGGGGRRGIRTPTKGL
jgi:hypothetical protein